MNGIQSVTRVSAEIARRKVLKKKSIKSTITTTTTVSIQILTSLLPLLSQIDLATTVSDVILTASGSDDVLAAPVLVRILLGMVVAALQDPVVA